MSINSWSNWVDIDVDTEVTFNGDLFQICGGSTVQFYSDENWVVDSFDGTTTNLNTGQDEIVFLNYRNNHNDPFFRRLREHIAGEYSILIQEAIREQIRLTSHKRYERVADPS